MNEHNISDSTIHSSDGYIVDAIIQELMINGKISIWDFTHRIYCVIIPVDLIPIKWKKVTLGDIRTLFHYFWFLTNEKLSI